MSGARLCALLGELGYEGAEVLDPDSFEWPFQYEDARPILDWICSSLRSSNVLSLFEVSQYEQFLEEGKLLEDWSTGKTIGIRCESQGLYHLTSPPSPATCISTDAPLLIHIRSGHPSLSKVQKMGPRLSTLSSLACESCQFGKHTGVSFPKRLK